MSRFWGWTVAILVLAGVADSFGFEATDYSFLLSAKASLSPAGLALSWAANPSKRISIRRKLPNDPEWGPVVATLPAGATTFVDEQVEVGKVYEYQVAGILSEQ